MSLDYTIVLILFISLIGMGFSLSYTNEEIKGTFEFIGIKATREKIDTGLGAVMGFSFLGIIFSILWFVSIKDFLEDYIIGTKKERKDRKEKFESFNKLKNPIKEAKKQYEKGLISKEDYFKILRENT